MEKGARDNQVEEMDTSDFKDAIAKVKVMLREKALALLASDQYYKNNIKDAHISIAKGLVELSKDSENVHERVAELEAAITTQASDFRTQEVMMQFGQMSITMNSQVGLDPSFSSKLSDDENSATISQMERLYQLQTTYRKLNIVLQDLVKTRRKLQNESLDYIVKSRCKYLEMKKMKKKLKLDDDEANTLEETREKGYLKSGVRVHLIISKVFEELIMCSQLNWYKDPQLKARLIRLKTGLELET